MLHTPRNDPTVRTSAGQLTEWLCVVVAFEVARRLSAGSGRSGRASENYPQPLTGQSSAIRLRRGEFDRAAAPVPLPVVGEAMGGRATGYEFQRVRAGRGEVDRHCDIGLVGKWRFRFTRAGFGEVHRRPRSEPGAVLSQAMNRISGADPSGAMFAPKAVIRFLTSIFRRGDVLA